MTQETKIEKLEKVRKVYSFWGKFPSLYGAQDAITFLGRAKTIRSRAVKKMSLKRGDKVLEVACGSGRNFPYLVETVGKDGFILGFDYSQEMLDAAKRLSKRNGWNNIKKALNRCYDVLHHGGKLVVCDARLFTGFLKILNPLVRVIYSKFAAWDPSKNIPEKMKEIFGNVEVENLNLGTFFIAVAVKKD